MTRKFFRFCFLFLVLILPNVTHGNGLNDGTQRSLNHKKLSASNILMNGKIFTADESNPWAEAIAWREGWILAVGTDEEVMERKGPHTEVTDLQGKTVIPGINDAHTHAAPFNSFGPLIAPPDWIPFGPGPTLSETLDHLAAAATQFPPGTWLYGIVGDAFITDPAVNRDVLSAITPDHPILLYGWTGHGVFINNKAMEVQGLSEYEPDPVGGWYARFPDGRINGILWEYAQFLFLKNHRMMVPAETLREQLAQIFAIINQFGVTSVQTMSMLPQDHYADILNGMDLTVRVRNICVPFYTDGGFEECANGLFNPFDKVISTGRKAIGDGTPGPDYLGAVENFVYLNAPQGPGWQGELNFSDEVLQEFLSEGLGFPLVANQLLFHAIGDRTIGQYIRVLKTMAPDWLWQFRRPRMEHADLITPEQMWDFGAMSGYAVLTPSHDALLDLWVDRFGPVIIPAIVSPRALINHGVKVVLGTDSIGGAGNPFVEIMLAVMNIANPADGLTVEEAVTAFTLTAAEAEFMEWFKGSLKTGKFADFAVLTQDIFTIPVPNIQFTASHMTVVDGKVVYTDGTF